MNPRKINILALIELGFVEPVCIYQLDVIFWYPCLFPLTLCVRALMNKNRVNPNCYELSSSIYYLLQEA
jgi:hypothetical protein